MGNRGRSKLKTFLLECQMEDPTGQTVQTKGKFDIDHFIQCRIEEEITSEKVKIENTDKDPLKLSDSPSCENKNQYSRNIGNKTPSISVIQCRAEEEIASEKRKRSESTDKDPLKLTDSPSSENKNQSSRNMNKTPTNSGQRLQEKCRYCGKIMYNVKQHILSFHKMPANNGDGDAWWSRLSGNKV